MNVNIATLLVLTLLFKNITATSWSDYLINVKNYFNYETSESVSLSEDQIPKVPYEVSTTDEKFISEAFKLTGVALSELDSCQQRVKFLCFCCYFCKINSYLGGS